MSVTVAELVAKLYADTTGFNRGLDAASRQLDKTGSRLKSFGNDATALGKKMSLGITAPITAMAIAGFRELDQAQRQQAITAAHIKSTGAAANVTAGHIGKMAEKLMLLSGTDDELIASGSNMLLTFKKVRNEAGEGNKIFDRATKAALDLSYQFGSTDSAAKMLGKALNDPVKGMTALKKAGVDLSEEQKNQVKLHMFLGDTLGAQKIILGEVESQVGKTAEAYGKTLGGQVAIAKESLKNASADMIAIAAPAIGKIASVLKKVADFLMGMPDWAKKAFGVLAGAAATLGPLLLVVGSIAKNLAAIQAFRGVGGLAAGAGASGAAGAGAGAAEGAAGGAVAGGAAGGGALLGGGIAGPAAAIVALYVTTKMIEAANVSQTEKAFKAVGDGSKYSAKELKGLQTALENWKAAKSNGGIFEAQDAMFYRDRLAEIRQRFDDLIAKSPAMGQVFIDQAAKAGINRTVLQGLREDLLRTAGNYLGRVDIDVSQAQQALQILIDKYSGMSYLFGKFTPAGIAAMHGMVPAPYGFVPKGPVTLMNPNGLPQGATGGFIPGPTGKPFPMIAHGGEQLIPAKDVGTSGGTTVNHFHIAGSVLTEKKLIDLVHEGFLAKQRKSGNLGLN